MVRTCSTPGCGEDAYLVGGYYIVPSTRRRVRLWVCGEHYEGEGALREVPLPESIKAAEREFARMQAENEARVRRQGITRSESLKTMAPSGHGKAVPVGRVESWRFETIRTYVL